MSARDMFRAIVILAILLLIVANFITWQHNAAYQVTPEDPSMYIQLPTK